MQVNRRLVIYVQGYDPRGMPEYYRMFRREFRRTCELYGLTGQVSGIERDAERFTTHWDVTTGGDGWQVDTRYQFLRWDDIIRNDFLRPPWWKIVHMYRVMLLALVNGVIPRIVLAHWRFGLFILYPLVLMTVLVLLAIATGVLCAKLTTRLGMPLPVDIAIGAAAGIAAFAIALRLTEGQTYLLYLCDDIVATHQFAHRRRPDWNARLEQFAAHMVRSVRASDADEVVVVGHSSGSFLAVDVVGRALVLDPDLGRHGPRVRLLTIGANLPIVGFQPRAQWFRERLRQLALENDVDWVDYQSRHDIMNFWPFDPVTGHGIVLGPERRNPLVVAISFRDLWKPGDFGRRRWRFFQAHFQFLLANELRGAAYDYYLICCGPIDLMTRATRPAEVAMNSPRQAAELPDKAKLV